MFAGTAARSSQHIAVKTQKPQGYVVARAVHASSRCMFSGLSHWLARELRRKLGGYVPYPLKDSQDLVSRIERIRHASGGQWHMATID
eukprot:353280-Pyramimonas_sp.AAC.1